MSKIICHHYTHVKPINSFCTYLRQEKCYHSPWFGAKSMESIKYFQNTNYQQLRRNTSQVNISFSFTLILASKLITSLLIWIYQFITYFFLWFTGAWYKHDNEDRPLFILRLGVMDVKGIIKSVSFLQIIYNLVWIRLATI